MRVVMLGPLQVWDAAGRPLDLGGARLRALLVRLAADAGRVVPVDTLVDDLWGGSSPAEARAALQTLVSRLRRALDAAAAQAAAGPRGGQALVVSSPAGYALAVDAEAVDALRFGRLAAAGRAALEAGEAGQAAARLDEALGLWRGPALGGVPDAPFTAGLAARLAETRLGAVEDRAEAYLALGRGGVLAADLGAAVAEAPLRERLWGLRMRALAAAGRQAEALAAYETARRTLDEELGILPSPQLRAAHLAVLRGQAPSPPPEPPDAGRPSGRDGKAAPGGCERRTNLRARLTSFIGREAELGGVSKLLGEARMVTVVGPGGAGKTRLAVECGARLVAQAAGDVWFVELAPVAEPADVAAAVLSALGVPERSLLDTRGGGAGALQRLVGVLGDLPCLLIVDNCEHVVSAVAAMAERLLGSCAGLRVLATSREPLGVAGEHLLPLPPLELPEAAATAEQALLSPAVRLFADRGAAVRPGFTLDAATAGPVVEICRRLDGLPLAIELAAARLRLLTPEQIAARLGDRFRLLTGGARTALPRHQTLRAVVDWSWEMLEAPERVLAGRLSVLPAGASLEAAERISAAVEAPAGGGAGSVGSVLESLATLVDKSLVTAVESAGPSGTAEMRYRMLETVRAYAAERLAASGEAEAVRAAHAAYAAGLAETLEPALRGADQLAAMRQLVAEHDNIMAALRWAIEARRPAPALRIAAGLGWYWTMRGEHGDAAYWLQRAVEVAEHAGPAAEAAAAPVQAMAYTLAGMNLAATGDDERAQAMLAAARRIREGTDWRGAYPMLAFVEIFAVIMADPLAPEYAERSEAVLGEAMDSPDAWTRAAAYLVRAEIRHNAGDPRSVEDHQKALEMFEAVGDRWGIAAAAGSLAEQKSYRGDPAAAVADLDRAVRLIDEMGPSADTAALRIFLAAQRLAAGEAATAEAELRELVRARPVFGGHEVAAMARNLLGDIERRRGRAARAAEWYRGAEQVAAAAATSADRHMRAICLAGRTHLAVSAGDLPRAREHAAEALQVAVAARDMPVVAQVAEAVAALALAEGGALPAARLLGASAAVRGRVHLGSVDRRALVAAITAAAGREAFEAAHGEGAALPRHEALAALAAACGAALGDALAQRPWRLPASAAGDGRPADRAGSRRDLDARARACPGAGGCPARDPAPGTATPGGGRRGSPAAPGR